MSFRAKILLASLATAGVSLLAVGLLVERTLERQMIDRAERTLVSQARLAAELLAGREAAADGLGFDDAADRMGSLLSARVTLIGTDGRVLGDSAEDGAALAALENHGSRPEVRLAREHGIGIARRHSTTLNADLLYVAAPVGGSAIATVRLALPLTDVAAQVGAVRRLALLAFLPAAAVALVLAWAASAILSQRVRAIAGLARRYASGDPSVPEADHGGDEIGQVARALEHSIRALGQRLADQARDRARMEAILAGMVEGVLVVNENGAIQSLNEAARQMLRLEPQDLMCHYADVVRHSAIAAHIRAALSGRVEQSVELILDGDPHRTFVARSAPVNIPGAPGAVLVLHDITDLKRADRIRRDFVANVSHELKTPLTAIRGYAEALGDEVAGGDARRFVDIIAKHTARMERLVRDLLRLARLDAGQETLDATPCDMRALVAGAVVEVASLIDRRRIHVTTAVAPEVASLDVDAAKLHDALRNLVENAANYAPDGGQIDVFVRQADGYVEISVADDGPGIPEADLSRVFERFYRVEQARSREPGGTGLGLSIVKHLVELHGGTVRAQNGPRGGAIVTIRLPVSRVSGDAQQPQEPVGTPPDGG